MYNSYKDAGKDASGCEFICQKSEGYETDCGGNFVDVLASKGRNIHF